MVGRKAAEFEEAVCNHLRTEGVPFQTEEDLRAFYSKGDQAGGDNQATPDIVLDASIVVNGQSVRWLDAKNFFGAAGYDHRSLFYKNARRQAERYKQIWGPGALVYGLGFCDDLQHQLRNCALCLDPTPFSPAHGLPDS